MPKVISGVKVLPSEDDARGRSFAIWLNRHPAEKDALLAHGILDVLSVAWEDCWREAAWDTTRRMDQLGLYLSEVCARLQEVAGRLDDAAAAEDEEDFYELQAAIRDNADRELLDWKDVEAELDRTTELEAEAEVGSALWATTVGVEESLWRMLAQRTAARASILEIQAVLARLIQVQRENTAAVASDDQEELPF